MPAASNSNLAPVINKLKAPVLVPVRAAGLLTLVGICAYWVRGYRADRFPVLGEPVEALALLGVGLLVETPIFILPLLG